MQSTPFFIRWWRITSIVIHTFTGVALAALVLPICNRNIRRRLIQWWCTRLLSCFNLRVTTSGQLPALHHQGVLFVANHISWSDIHALNSLMPVRFVAKMEIKDWPVFGYLVRKSGTIFIHRGRNRDAARVIHICSHALKQHDHLCVFPEGTTTEGLSVLPFKTSLIQAAIEAKTTVVPVAIHYPLPDGRANLAAAYAGDTQLLDSMNTYLHMRQPAVHLHFCAPIAAEGLTRQQLAQQAHAEITAALYG